MDLHLDDSLVTTNTLATVSASVQNFGHEASGNVRVELLVGRARDIAADNPFSLRTVDQQLVTLQPKELKLIRFRHQFTTPGTYALQVRLESDSLEPDDFRTVIITVKDTIPVLVVNGKPAADAYDRATEYLRLALNPFPRGGATTSAPK